MTIVRGQQRAERVRVAGIEGGEIRFRDGLRLLRGGDGAGGTILRQHAGDWETRRQDGNQASGSPQQAAPGSAVIRQRWAPLAASLIWTQVELYSLNLGAG